MYRINATALGWVGGRVGPIFCCIPGIVSEKVSYVVRRVGAGVGERGGLTMAVFLAETPSGYCLMLCYNARFICLLLFSFVVVPYSLPSRCHPPRRTLIFCVGCVTLVLYLEDLPLLL